MPVSNYFSKWIFWFGSIQNLSQKMAIYARKTPKSNFPHLLVLYLGVRGAASYFFNFGTTVLLCIINKMVYLNDKGPKYILSKKSDTKT